METFADYILAEKDYGRKIEIKIEKVKLGRQNKINLKHLFKKSKNCFIKETAVNSL